ncbi:hypothetical protein AB0C68_04755 [Streptomyces tendae]|uniref:hypothetical protein n=1 Tax=Streptomyces tendae TaxID=1932 RepID=UPI0033C609D1
MPGEFPPREPLTADQARAAFADLTDAQRRIVDEVFWFWGTACSGCHCPESVHRNHDDAVRAHVRALDAELSDQGRPPDAEATRQRNEEWTEAALQWRLLLRRAPFWEHLRTRLQALDDRRLDESVIDLLRGALPRTLVAPVVHLAVTDGAPERLVQQCLKWSDVGRHALDDALDDILSPRPRPGGRRGGRGRGGTAEPSAAKPPGPRHDPVPGRRTRLPAASREDPRPRARGDRCGGSGPGPGPPDRPVRVVAHSLGGVVAVDMATASAPLWTSSLLTFGSQAAFFHVCDPRGGQLAPYAGVRESRCRPH